MLSPFEFLLLFVASFRLTRLFVYDEITSFIRKPFHDTIEETLPDGTAEMFLVIKGSGIRRWIGELLSCYWCTGVWCSVLLYVGYVIWPAVFEPLVVIFAIAGCAAFIETIVQKLMSS